MGREIRRVPIDYVHPKEMVLGVCGYEARYIPKLDSSYEAALQYWWEDRQNYLKGDHPYYEKGVPYEEQCGAAPNPRSYFPSFDQPCDGWVVYETVSEGTPVTPVFGSPEELVNYLVENGDFWDQERRNSPRSSRIPCDPWPRKHAEEFVFGQGYRPSLVMSEGKAGRFIGGEEE